VARVLSTSNAAPPAVIPALDLLEGRAVRLRQSAVAATRERAEPVALDGGSPRALAQRFQRAPLLHVVDLDGAFAGRVVQTELIAALAAVVPLQVGGGVRSLKDIQQLVEAGARRVVIGTAALENPPLLEEALARFGAERIVPALDVTDGVVATSARGPREIAAGFVRMGVRHVLCTAVRRDGKRDWQQDREPDREQDGEQGGGRALERPDVEVLEQVAAAGLAVIAAGGIGSLADVRSVGTCAGVLVGEALWTGALRLEDLLAS
jgi:phosphoribosylformimino-5-aminoimidazole carboxamide ribotide isomerase